MPISMHRLIHVGKRKSNCPETKLHTRAYSIYSIYHKLVTPIPPILSPKKKVERECVYIYSSI